MNIESIPTGTPQENVKKKNTTHGHSIVSTANFPFNQEKRKK